MIAQARGFIRYGSAHSSRGRAILLHRPSPAVLSKNNVSPRPNSTSSKRQYARKGGASFKHSDVLTAFSAVAASGALFGGSLLCDCDASINNGSRGSSETPIDEESEDELPTYTMAQVSQNNGKGDGNRIWMTYGGCVYDATKFIANHPGGSERILMAAGGPIEPHWHIYRQHFASDLPLQLMEKMLVGYLDPDDQEKVDDYMEELAENESDDPYGHEPIRSSLLKVHAQQAMNAEVPREFLGKDYITPVSLFYIRHHHPVPLLSEKELQDFRLDVDVSILSKASDDKKQGQTAKLSLAQIKSLPKVEVTTTLQCSGNRRSGFNDFRKTSGTSWDQGAMSTAKWGGARLVDVLMLASQQLSENEKNNALGPAGKDVEGNLLQTLQKLQMQLSDHPNLQHLRFESLDGMLASIDITKAFSPFGDVIVAYEMNGDQLPRDHGYPLRVIVPGYAAVRNAKWLSKLELAEEQAEGMWQRGLNYKVLPPSVTDANEVDLEKMPGLGEVAVFSGITEVTRVPDGSGKKQKLLPGDTVWVKASGWAWAGTF
ncbi:hypothetical protein ACHAWF_005023 [Thalassiosira exigua]